MDQVLDHTYAVTSNLFGPESGIPWWAWTFILLGIFWKVLIPEQKTAQQRSAERDEQMLAELFAGDGGTGKKAKKKK
ncbi:hypothetical protein GCM10010172_16640 [Paractinoplanes ferrugineus]|uniref:Uncharacterized protein n=1 Tax=Paractinoplanes ferrugineus TaxID=113564 RepID=A0A919IZM8_9ACTN|nr:hypothetical protein [Actinoplanes ferrugineus]GIE10228.1 hypothetical protein Afe05nite_20680 [Actinoplanes ferrugineus]